MACGPAIVGLNLFRKHAKNVAQTREGGDDGQAAQKEEEDEEDEDEDWNEDDEPRHGSGLLMGV